MTSPPPPDIVAQIRADMDVPTPDWQSYCSMLRALRFDEPNSSDYLLMNREFDRECADRAEVIAATKARGETVDETNELFYYVLHGKIDGLPEVSLRVRPYVKDLWSDRDSTANDRFVCRGRQTSRGFVTSKEETRAEEEEERLRDERLNSSTRVEGEDDAGRT